MCSKLNTLKCHLSASLIDFCLVSWLTTCVDCCVHFCKINRRFCDHNSHKIFISYGICLQTFLARKLSNTCNGTKRRVFACIWEQNIARIVGFLSKNINVTFRRIFYFHLEFCTFRYCRNGFEQVTNGGRQRNITLRGVFYQTDLTSQNILRTIAFWHGRNTVSLLCEGHKFFIRHVSYAILTPFCTPRIHHLKRAARHAIIVADEAHTVPASRVASRIIFLIGVPNFLSHHALHK